MRPRSASRPAGAQSRQHRLDRTAGIGDAEEIAEVAWVGHGQIAEYVPYGLFEPVQDYLDEVLPR
ncbi:hypothetical protein [Streptomyces drozdowiczii]|uniref:hypothetical protein n=1 Tax=Streptomyces drozdowiczii TaxID=202862 RepID=UPI00403CCD40